MPHMGYPQPSIPRAHGGQPCCRVETQTGSLLGDFRACVGSELDPERGALGKINANPEAVKTTVKLTPENASTLSWWSKLTGLPTEELINFVLDEYFLDFISWILIRTTTKAFPRRPSALLKCKDRNGAERALEWVKSRVLKEYRGRHPVFESSIDELPDGSFQIDPFISFEDGESSRVC
jgi:hypothetical protein